MTPWKCQPHILSTHGPELVSQCGVCKTRQRHLLIVFIPAHNLTHAEIHTVHVHTQTYTYRQMNEHLNLKRVITVVVTNAFEAHILRNMYFFNYSMLWYVNKR